MSNLIVELLIVFALIAINGVFSMAEIAIVSSRKARLERLKTEGSDSAGVALSLAENPDDFLSTVQVGITLVGVLTGAYSGVTLAEQLAPALNQLAFVAPHGRSIALTLIVIATTYLSLIIGELVPKRLALRSPERIASATAPMMQRISQLARPAVWLLTKSTDAVMTLFGRPVHSDGGVTEDEVKLLLRQATASGAFLESEQEMVERVFAFGDRPLTSLMTPRADIAWLDVHAPADECRRTLLAEDHDSYPVCDRSLDHVLGAVKARDLLKQCLGGGVLDLHAILQKPTYVPELASPLTVLEILKNADTRVALIVDEYGAVQGLLTLNDLMQEIAGFEEESGIVQRSDGSWLIDGIVSIVELRESFDLASFEDGPFQTIGGFVMAKLGRIPRTGDVVEWRDFRFEVVDMDANRVDKLLVSRNTVQSGTP